MIPANCKKATQALNYFARKKDGKINKMKAVKLIYFADRFHIRKYGRPIVGDAYLAMKYGPVGSIILNVADFEDSIGDECLKYASTYISHPKDDKLRTLISKKEVDLDVFSQSDIEAFERVYAEFGGYDEFELAEITHKYPEWSRFKKEILVEKKKREKMNYQDFFSNPKSDGSDFFDLPPDHLEMSREMFEENREAISLLK